MAIIIRKITNNLNFSYPMPIPGDNNNQNALVTIPPSVINMDLLEFMTEDNLWSIQPTLLILQERGSITVTGTVDTASFDYEGVSTIQADSNPPLNDAVTLASGSHITLSQVGQTVTINATGELSAALTENHIFVGNGSNVATDVAMFGDVSIVASGSTTLSSTAAVKSLHADSNVNLTGDVQLVSGTGISLSQTGQAITVTSTATGITQLTGDVTAGPGSGSVAATIASGAVTSSKIAAGAILPAAITATNVTFTFPAEVTAPQFVATSYVQAPILIAGQLTGTADASATWSAIGAAIQNYASFAWITSSYVAQTIPAGGYARVGQIFTVFNDSTSTANFSVSGSVLAPGQGQMFIYGYDNLWHPLVDGFRNAVTPLAGTGTVTSSAVGSTTLTVPVSGDVTLEGPTGALDGQKITLRIVNDSSHSVRLDTGSGNFAFGTTITSYTNSVSTIDYIGVIYNSSASVWHVVSIVQGF